MKRKTPLATGLGLVVIMLVLGFSPIGSQITALSPSSTNPGSLFPSHNVSKLAPAAFAYEPDEFSNLSSYDIWLHLLEGTSQVEGIITANFLNSDPVNISEIPFHLFPHEMEYISRPGDIVISNVTTLDAIPEEMAYTVDKANDLLWVSLPEEIGQYNSIEFAIYFLTTLPDGGIDRASDTGLDSDSSRIIKFAAAYPMPCVWDTKDGWNTDPYLPVGDPFYEDMAWYNMTVQVPTGYVVAGTGEIISSDVQGGDTFFHFSPGLPVREVTFSCSRYFLSDSLLFGEVNISTFYLPSMQALWENNAVNTAKDVISLYSQSIGAYPYPSFNVVQEYTAYGGMEHACQVYISGIFSQLSNLKLVIAHESAHQYFYHLIGNDEIDAGYLDEGMACWLEDYYMDHAYPNSDYYFQFSAEAQAVREHFAQTGDYERLNASIYDCAQDGYAYWYLAYSKAPVIFEKLRLYIGNASFFGGLQRLFQEKSFQNVWLEDYQTAFENASGLDLTDFFNMWFNNPYLPDYKLTDVVYNTETHELNFTIVDLNTPLNPYTYEQNISLGDFLPTGVMLKSYPIEVSGNESFSIQMILDGTNLGLDYAHLGLAQTSSNQPYEIFPDTIISYVNGNGPSGSDDAASDDGSNDDTRSFRIPVYPPNVLYIAALVGIALIITKIRQNS